MHSSSDVRAKPCHKERDAAQRLTGVPGVTPLQHARVTAASKGIVMKTRQLRVICESRQGPMGRSPSPVC